MLHFRHGLSLPVHSDPAWSEEVQALAREIAASNANADIHDIAHRVAEAHIDLRRIRHARHRLLSRASSDPYYDSRANTRDKVAFLCALLRQNAPDVPMAAVEKFLASSSEGPQWHPLAERSQNAQSFQLGQISFSACSLCGRTD